MLGIFSAVFYFDSGIIGGLVAFTLLIIIFRVWIFGAYSKNFLIFSIFCLLFPRLLFVLNFTIASVFEIVYYALYTAIIYVLAVGVNAFLLQFLTVRTLNDDARHGAGTL